MKAKVLWLALEEMKHQRLAAVLLPWLPIQMTGAVPSSALGRSSVLLDRVAWSWWREQTQEHLGPGALG